MSRENLPCLLAVALTAGCGSAGQGDILPVGSDAADDGGGSFVGADATASGALNAYIEQGSVHVTFITLSCSGDCATVQAVATGGHQPYTYKWEDGSTSASRHVCPTSNMNYSVKVTDTATTGEFPRPAETAQASLTADVLACPDGGVTGAGTGLDGGPALLLTQTSFAPFTGATIGVREGSTTIYWADWQSSTSGTATGVLSPPSGPIQVAFNGGDIYGVQTSVGMNYWTPASTYMSATVANAPPGPGIIEINGGGSQPDAFTFSKPVTNPVLAIVSLGTGPIGSAMLDVNAPVDILSSGIGYQGSGLGSGVLSTTDGGVTGVEGNGVLEVVGTF